jgi:hypothetical protein
VILCIFSYEDVFLLRYFIYNYGQWSIEVILLTAITCLLMLWQAGSWVLIILLFLAVNPDLEKLKFEVRKF